MRRLLTPMIHGLLFVLTGILTCAADVQAVSPTPLFRNEVSLLGQFTEFEMDNLERYSDDEAWTYHSHDKFTMIGVDVIHRPDGRYLRQDIPFFAIPFNVRRNYVRGLFLYDRFSYTSDSSYERSVGDSDTSRHAESWQTYEATVQTWWGFDGPFLGGSAYFSEPSRGEGHQVFFAEAGFENELLMLGVGCRSMKDELRGLSEDLTGSAYLHCTPTPWLILSVAAKRIFNKDRMAGTTSTSSSATFVSAEYGWEFGAAGYVSSSDNDWHSLSASGHVGRHWMKLYAEIRAEYSESDVVRFVRERRSVTGLVRIRIDENLFAGLSVGSERAEAVDLDPSFFDSFSSLELIQYRDEWDTTEVRFQVGHLF